MLSGVTNPGSPPYVDTTSMARRKLEDNVLFLAHEVSDLKNFNPSAVDSDNYTIMFPQHPCVILNALEVLGFHIVTATPSTQPPHTIVWTMRKDFEA